MAYRAWGALGAVGVLVMAAMGCDRGADGGSHPRRVQALAALSGDDAAGDDAAGDDAAGGGPGLEEAGVDAAVDMTGAPETEPAEASGAPEDAAVADEAAPETDDASGSSSGGSSSGSSSGTMAPPEQESGAPVLADSGSNGRPDSGAEAASPIDSGNARETGTPRSHTGGLRVPAQQGNASDPAGAAVGGAPAFGDDASSWDDASTTFGGSWDGDGGPSNLDLAPPRAILGCAGCSVPDASGSSELAWLLVASTVLVRACRRRARR